jgi:hypothetical protein
MHALCVHPGLRGFLSQKPLMPGAEKKSSVTRTGGKTRIERGKEMSQKGQR